MHLSRKMTDSISFVKKCDQCTSNIHYRYANCLHLSCLNFPTEICTINPFNSLRLINPIIVFNLFNQQIIQSLLLKMKCVFQHKDQQIFGLIFMSHFHPVEVVRRGRKTQFEVAENLK